jgi:hypothetical protein
MSKRRLLSRPPTPPGKIVLSGVAHPFNYSATTSFLFLLTLADRDRTRLERHLHVDQQAPRYLPLHLSDLRLPCGPGKTKRRWPLAGPQVVDISPPLTTSPISSHHSLLLDPFLYSFVGSSSHKTLRL